MTTIRPPSTQTQKSPLLGAPAAGLVLYLPNRPSTPTSARQGHTPDVPGLMLHNGNHWRKIFSILAKLCSPTDQPWQHYRDRELLQQHEVICFADHLLTGPRWHLVAGKASWQRLGLDPRTFSLLDDEGRVLLRDNILLTPYPDYRQFPNRTVAQVRALFKSER